MSSNLKLSILDYVHIFQDEKTADSVRNTTELIQLAEQLGFTRYWFTEHHSSLHILSMAPDLLSSMQQHIPSICVSDQGALCCPITAH